MRNKEIFNNWFRSNIAAVLRKEQLTDFEYERILVLLEVVATHHNDFKESLNLRNI